MTDQLKACPFCGGQATIIEAEDIDGRFAAVGCSKCGCGSRQHYFLGDDARQQVTSAWNARALADDHYVDMRKMVAEDGDAAADPIGYFCFTSNDRKDIGQVHPMHKGDEDAFPLYTRPTHAQEAGEDGWQPIGTAPNDGTMHVRGLHVFSSTDGRFLYWDAVVGHVDTEDGLFYDQGGDVCGWDAADFTHWCPLPDAPALSAQRGEVE